MSNSFYQQQLKSKSREYLRANAKASGFILKEKSPSCGLEQCKYYLPAKEKLQGRTAGILPREIKKHFIHSFIITEEGLTDSRALYYFLLKVFTWQRWLEVKNNFSIARLQKFQTYHKLLFLGFNRQIVDQMGKLIAQQKKYSPAVIINRFEDLLLRIFQFNLSRPRWNNVILHGFGHLSDYLSAKSKENFLNKLAKFREGKLNFWPLHHWLADRAAQYEVNYLTQQFFLFPYPREINLALEQINKLPDPFA